MVKFWDRYRFYVSIFGIAAVCWLFWYLNATWQAITKIDEHDPLIADKITQSLMLISLFVGLMLGLNIAGLLAYIFKSIFGGYRAERLLLRLDEELKQCRSETNAR